jgi:UDPglucose--hexose-1-phosphate uridylyltransferase
MGLAVLPGRLENELDIIANILSGNIAYSKESALDNEDISKHVPWIENMMEKYKDIKLEEAKVIVKEEVGRIFSNVLEHAGVFKRNEKGQKGLQKFLNSVL